MPKPRLPPPLVPLPLPSASPPCPTPQKHKHTRYNSTSYTYDEHCEAVIIIIIIITGLRHWQTQQLAPGFWNLGGAFLHTKSSYILYIISTVKSYRNQSLNTVYIGQYMYRCMPIMRNQSITLNTKCRKREKRRVFTYNTRGEERLKRSQIEV